jgi:TM2 domain-containing membrane protein YozV
MKNLKRKRTKYYQEFNMKSKFTTALLAFFLGGLGIHRFYLGQNGMGILYLIFCWTFIPAMISLIDFFVFIFMSEDRFNHKYNSRTGFYN